jgi:nucleoid-associated protein YgaU
MLAFQPTAPVTFPLVRPVRPVRPARGTAAPVTAATYARRRLVAGILLAVLVVVAAIGVSWLAAPATGTFEARPVAEVQVLVQPGDTVWSIATEMAGGGDVRPVVDAIIDLRGNAPLQPGETILLP